MQGATLGSCKPICSDHRRLDTSWACYRTRTLTSRGQSQELQPAQTLDNEVGVKDQYGISGIVSLSAGDQSQEAASPVPLKKDVENMEKGEWMTGASQVDAADCSGVQ